MRVKGFIERQVVPDGADVKAGDLLFVTDPRPTEAALCQAEANVARDSAALRQAEAARTQREADMRQALANVDRDVAGRECPRRSALTPPRASATSTSRLLRQRACHHARQGVLSVPRPSVAGAAGFNGGAGRPRAVASSGSPRRIWS